MSKKIIFTVLVFLWIQKYNSQVGINTSSPVATLDIKPLNSTGSSSNTDGLLIPRVDRERAQSMQNIPTATLVYVNDIATGDLTGKTVNIDQTGFYSFNGSVWVKFGLESVAPISERLAIYLNSATSGTAASSGGFYRLLVNQENVITANTLGMATGRDVPLNRDYFVFPEIGTYEVLIQGNFAASSFVNTASISFYAYSSPAPYTSFTQIDSGRAGILSSTIGTNTSYTFYINITEPNQRIAFAYQMGGSGNSGGRPQLIGGRATSFVFRKL